uniref:Uncharacterized protein n=1 Tax=Arundo donax TaxID=35708 RepID=A0A0A8ZYL5_ARUDO
MTKLRRGKVRHKPNKLDYFCGYGGVYLPGE